MAVLEWFTVTGNLSAIIVDYVDVGTDPDIQKISATCTFIPRLPNGGLVWAPGLSPKQGLALAPVLARFDTDGYLRTIQAQAVNETQTVTVTGNPFTLSWNGAGPTSNIASGVPSSTVQTALQALSNIGVGNVSVGGPNGGPYVVTFAGALAAQDLPQMTASNATVSTTRNGSLNAGVKLTANTAAIDLDELIYDVVFQNVVYNRADQVISPFAFAAPTTGGGTVDLADLTLLPPKAGL